MGARLALALALALNLSRCATTPNPNPSPDPSPNTNPIQVRYHAFNESEDSDVKLVDTVAVRRLHRARAHPTPALAGFTRP